MDQRDTSLNPFIMKTSQRIAWYTAVQMEKACHRLFIDPYCSQNRQLTHAFVALHTSQLTASQELSQLESHVIPVNCHTCELSHPTPSLFWQELCSE